MGLVLALALLLGKSADTVTELTGNVVVDAVTFPYRLVGRVFGALFG
ncbi:MAG: hypothetical protein ABW298_14295 [Candidatus Binatia bacterium]